MTIGGLTVGVTPLDMAHAYETIAHGGRRVSGTLAESGAPVGIQEVEAGGRPLPDGARHDRNRVRTQPVLPPAVAQTETSMLETVLQYGTGRAAALGQFAAGKTGTTSNYGDAWFVGWDSKYTVAVWVGYPDKLVPMSTDFNGNPVLGGTYPALIWHDFMTAALQIDKNRAEQAAAAKNSTGNTGAPSTTGTPETSAPSSATTTPGQGTGRRWQGRQALDSRRGGQRSRRRGSNGGPRTRRGALDAGAGTRIADPLRARCPGSRCPLIALADGRGESRRLAATLSRSQPARGLGRETWGLWAAQKRQRSSTARVMPTRVPSITVGSSQSPARGWMRIGPLMRLVAFSASEMAIACVSLPGPEQSSCSRGGRPEIKPRRARIRSIPDTGSERADENARADPRGLADRVQERVDAVGAVDVGRSRLAVQRLGARRQTRERVRGRLAFVVGLGLDDHTRRTPVLDGAADQIRGDLEHRAIVEVSSKRPHRAPLWRGRAAPARAPVTCRPRRPSTRARSSARAHR